MLQLEQLEVVHVLGRAGEDLQAAAHVAQEDPGRVGGHELEAGAHEFVHQLDEVEWRDHRVDEPDDAGQELRAGVSGHRESPSPHRECRRGRSAVAG